MDEGEEGRAEGKLRGTLSCSVWETESVLRILEKFRGASGSGKKETL